MSDPVLERDDQRISWDRFYHDNNRPWRGVGKIEGLEVSKGDRALDIGCGNGKTVSALLQSGAQVTGLDFSDEAISYCKKTFGTKARFIVSDCSELPFEDGSFDIVTMVHVLEHLDEGQLSMTVSEVKRVLSPGGKILVRAFAVDDMRASGEESNVRGNGIKYRYFTLENIESIFSDMEIIRAETIEDKMRFGGVRVRVECIFQRHM
jgi:ubiquinone/menaquinone biosynthesis C-methylase UbiE